MRRSEVQRSGRSPSPLGRAASAAAAGVVALLAGVAAEAAGSHFVLEMNQGLSVPLGYGDGYEAGYGWGMTLGVGFKLKDNPIRFYAIGQFNASSFSGDFEYNGRRRLVDRAITDVSGGLRLLLPVQGQNLRVFAELSLGQAQVESSATSPDLPGRIRIQDADADVALFTGAGAQWRFSYWFSLGGKADFGFIFDDDEFDAVTLATTGDGDAGQTGRLNLSLTATLHF